MLTYPGGNIETLLYIMHVLKETNTFILFIIERDYELFSSRLMYLISCLVDSSLVRGPILSISGTLTEGNILLSDQCFKEPVGFGLPIPVTVHAKEVSFLLII